MFKTHKAALWLSGVLLIVLGAFSIGLAQPLIGSLCGVLAGLLLLPPVQHGINRLLGRNVPLVVFCIIAVVLCLGGGIATRLPQVVDQPPTVALPPAPPKLSQPEIEAQKAEQQLRAKMKMASAPPYDAQQEQKVLEQVKRSDQDAKIMHDIAMYQAAQSDDCDRIIKNQISPLSTSSNLVMTVSCANTTTYTIHESRLPTEQQ